MTNSDNRLFRSVGQKFLFTLFVGLFWHSANAKQLEPYLRPDILTINPVEHPELPEIWRRQLHGHLEAAAQILELYPDHDIYFLARDSELLFDFSRLLLKNEPQQSARVHLLNISGGTMYDANLINYLAQEGISESSLRDGKKVLLVDTGFKGSVAQVVRENFPADLRKNIHGHLLFSNNPSFPFSTIFQQSLSQHREIFSFEGHEFTTFLESLPRYTDKSTEFHLLNGRWTPMSSTELPRLDEKTPVDREKAQMYRESLVHYVEIPEAQRLFTERRATYRKLISLRNKPDELKAELIALLNKNSPIKFNEDLSALLQQSERRNVSTRYFKALVRDFLMSQRINGANLLLPSEDELGIGDLSDGPFSKSDILKQYPQWEHLIESPDTTIPILLEKGDFITLINAVNALENVKFLQSIVDSLEKIEDPKPMHLTLVRLLVMKGSEEVARDIAHKLLSKPKWKYPELAAGLISYGCGVSFLIEFALSKPHWNDQPELVEEIIKQGRNDLFVERFILNQPHWRNSLDLRAIYGEAKPSAELFRKALVSSLSSRQLDFPNASSNDCRGLLKILSISK